MFKQYIVLVDLRIKMAKCIIFTFTFDSVAISEHKINKERARFARSLLAPVSAALDTYQVKMKMRMLERSVSEQEKVVQAISSLLTRTYILANHVTCSISYS